MSERLYTVLCNEEEVIARAMHVGDAVMLAETLLNKYWEDPEMSVTVRRERTDEID